MVAMASPGFSGVGGEPANNGVTKNTVNNHTKALQAVSWLQQH